MADERDTQAREAIELAQISSQNFGNKIRELQAKSEGRKGKWDAIFTNENELRAENNKKPLQSISGNSPRL